MALSKDKHLGHNEHLISSSDQLNGRKEHIKLLEKSNKYYSKLKGDDYKLRIARNKTKLTNARIWAAAYEGRWHTKGKHGSKVLTGFTFFTSNLRQVSASKVA